MWPCVGPRLHTGQGRKHQQGHVGCDITGRGIANVDGENRLHHFQNLTAGKNGGHAQLVAAGLRFQIGSGQRVPDFWIIGFGAARRLANPCPGNAPRNAVQRYRDERRRSLLQLVDARKHS